MDGSKLTILCYSGYRASLIIEVQKRRRSQVQRSSKVLPGIALLVKVFDQVPDLIGIFRIGYSL